MKTGLDMFIPRVQAIAESMASRYGYNREVSGKRKNTVVSRAKNTLEEALTVQPDDPTSGRVTSFVHGDIDRDNHVSERETAEIYLAAKAIEKYGDEGDLPEGVTLSDAYDVIRGQTTSLAPDAAARHGEWNPRASTSGSSSKPEPDTGAIDDPGGSSTSGRKEKRASPGGGQGSSGESHEERSLLEGRNPRYWWKDRQEIPGGEPEWKDEQPSHRRRQKDRRRRKQKGKHDPPTDDIDDPSTPFDDPGAPTDDMPLIGHPDSGQKQKNERESSRDDSKEFGVSPLPPFGGFGRHRDFLDAVFGRGL